MKDDNFDLMPEEIEALLNEEADDALVQRVRDNPALHAEIEAMRAFRDELHHALQDDMEYPSSTLIGEYVLGMLSDKASIRFEQLLSQSPRLRHDVKQLRDYLDKDLILPENKALNRTIIWGQKLETAEHERVRVAGDDKQQSLTLEADGHSLLLELQEDYEHNTRLLGQFITEDMDAWAGAQVKVHFRNGAVAEFRLDELNTFDEAWEHPREFAVHIINEAGDVFHTGLISI